MSTQETIENSKLAADFQDLLIQELQERGVRFIKATAENFSDLNIDVHIWIEDYWMMYSFKYIGINWLKRRKLAEMTLEAYVKGYVDRELEELKGSVEYNLKDLPRQLENKGLSESYRRSIERHLGAARKIAMWLK
jgi:hypothetical protein